MRKALRRTLTVAALTGLIAGAGTASADTSTAGVTVTLQSSNVFYTDFTPPSMGLVLNAEYIQFLITNNTAPPVPITSVSLTIPANAGGVALSEV